jgi:hypothetical protein
MNLKKSDPEAVSDIKVTAVERNVSFEATYFIYPQLRNESLGEMTPYGLTFPRAGRLRTRWSVRCERRQLLCDQAAKQAWFGSFGNDDVCVTNCRSRRTKPGAISSDTRPEWAAWRPSWPRRRPRPCPWTATTTSPTPAAGRLPQAAVRAVPPAEAGRVAGGHGVPAVHGPVRQPVLAGAAPVLDALRCRPPEDDQGRVPESFLSEGGWRLAKPCTTQTKSDGDGAQSEPAV